MLTSRLNTTRAAVICLIEVAAAGDGPVNGERVARAGIIGNIVVWVIPWVALPMVADARPAMVPPCRVQLPRVRTSAPVAVPRAALFSTRSVPALLVILPLYSAALFWRMRVQPPLRVILPVPASAPSMTRLLSTWKFASPAAVRIPVQVPVSPPADERGAGVQGHVVGDDTEAVTAESSRAVDGDRLGAGRRSRNLQSSDWPSSST